MVLIKGLLAREAGCSQAPGPREVESSPADWLKSALLLLSLNFYSLFALHEDRLAHCFPL